MPRRKFDSVPEVITASDFVKMNTCFSYMHWDKDVLLYHCPYSNRYTIVTASVLQLFKLHPRALAQGTVEGVVVLWYKTIKELVHEQQAFLQDRLIHGNAYKKLTGIDVVEPYKFNRNPCVISRPI